MDYPLPLTHPVSLHRISSAIPSDGGYQRVNNRHTSEHITYTIPTAMARPMLARERLHDTAIPAPAAVRRYSGEGIQRLYETKIVM